VHKVNYMNLYNIYKYVDCVEHHMIPHRVNLNFNQIPTARAINDRGGSSSNSSLKGKDRKRQRKWCACHWGQIRSDFATIYFHFVGQYG